MRWQSGLLMALLLPASPVAQDAASPPAPAAARVDFPPEVQKPVSSNAEQKTSDLFRLNAANISNNDSQNSMCLMLEAAARSNGLPVEFFARVIWQESRFRPDAVGPVARDGQQAQGIAQFMPGTALDRNLLNPFDPVQALPKSAEFLRELRVQFGNLGLAAAAYNAGPRRVREWISGLGPMPAETRNYVLAITGTPVDEWAKVGPDRDLKLDSGLACAQLMALLKKTPNPFVEALEQRIVMGSTQPWTVILTAGFSRTRILGNYAKVERTHGPALHGYDAFITQINLHSRGTVPFYQVRIGVPDRTVASTVCNRIRQEHGACVIMRNPRA